MRTSCRMVPSVSRAVSTIVLVPSRSVTGTCTTIEAGGLASACRCHLAAVERDAHAAHTTARRHHRRDHRVRLRHPVALGRIPDGDAQRRRLVVVDRAHLLADGAVGVGRGDHEEVRALAQLERRVQRHGRAGRRLVELRHFGAVQRHHHARDPAPARDQTRQRHRTRGPRAPGRSGCDTLDGRAPRPPGRAGSGFAILGLRRPRVCAGAGRGGSDLGAGSGLAGGGGACAMTERLAAQLEGQQRLARLRLHDPPDIRRVPEGDVERASRAIRAVPLGGTRTRSNWPGMLGIERVPDPERLERAARGADRLRSLHAPDRVDLDVARCAAAG